MAEEQTRGTPYSLATAPGFAARRLYQAYSALWATQVDSTLTGPQFAVMTAVRALPGGDQRSLAAAVFLDSSTMGDVCRRLEQRGLILREPSPEDGRRKMLTLTAHGEEELDDVTERSRQLNDVLLRTVAVERQEALVTDLFELSEAWERLAREA